MVIDFEMEAAKRREHPRTLASVPSKTPSRRLFEVRPQAADRTWPTADCGSGWYHADAMQAADPIQSHRD